MNIQYIMSSSGAFSAVVDGKNYNVDSSHPNYRDLFYCLKGGDNCEREFIELYDVASSVETKSDGNFCILDGVVHYKGKPVHETISRYIMEISNLGLPYDNIVVFIENLYLNPSKRAVEQLFGFMQNKGLPVTEDGYIIAWKAVDQFFRDKWTGKVDNTPGCAPSMPRNEIDEDADCGPGFHGGSLQFCSNYGYGEDKVIQIKIHPKDVVNIPRHCSCEKIRFSDYEVLREFDHPLNAPVVTEDGEMYEDDPDEETCEDCGQGYNWCDCGEEIEDED